eukprot:1157939-Pelagomonas_calceolata.AAC.6
MTNQFNLGQYCTNSRRRLFPRPATRLETTAIQPEFEDYHIKMHCLVERSTVRQSVQLPRWRGT